MSGLPTFGEFTDFLYSQFFVTPKYPTTSCAGKIVVVTGANVGLGKETARHYVRLGAAKVIIGVRNLTAGEEAKANIEKSQNVTNICEVWKLDMLDYSSVTGFAKKVHDLERIDIVVLGAGMATNNFGLSSNGMEKTIDTNVIATMLLALSLFPALTTSARMHNTTPVLVMVSSEVHMWARFKERAHLPSSPANADSKTPLFDALADEKKANMGDRYNLSKLLEVLSLRAVTKRAPFETTGFVFDTVTPGLCHSSLMRELEGVAKTVAMGIFARSTEVGARCFVNAGLEGPEAHGQFLQDCKVTEPGLMVLGTAPKNTPRGAYVQGEELQEMVWEELKIKLEAIAPSVTKVVE